jgi:Family of unknown function (DUF6428)
MTTHDFIGRLREAPAKQLVFTNSDGATIHGGYHLTELKAASFDTVDCGAEKNQWNETIVQLWVPEDEENGEFMTAQKFLAIYDKVARLIPPDPTAEIRFEYGDENFPPSNYHVKSVTENETDLHVELRLPETTCKARGRRESGATCCS